MWQAAGGLARKNVGQRYGIGRAGVVTRRQPPDVMVAYGAFTARVRVAQDPDVHVLVDARARGGGVRVDLHTLKVGGSGQVVHMEDRSPGAVRLEDVGVRRVPVRITAVDALDAHVLDGDVGGGRRVHVDAVAGVPGMARVRIADQHTLDVDLAGRI